MAERVCCGCLVPRRGEGRVTGDAAGTALFRRPAWLPAERAHCRRGGAEGALGYSSVPPALSPPESPGGRAEEPRCRSALPLCPGVAAMSRSLQAPGSARSGEGGAGKSHPSSAESKQRALSASCVLFFFFSRRHWQSPNLGETESSLESGRTRWCSRGSARPWRCAGCRERRPGWAPRRLGPLPSAWSVNAQSWDFREEQTPVYQYFQYPLSGGRHAPRFFLRRGDGTIDQTLS